MEHVLKTIDDAKAQLRQQEEEVLRLKKLINHLCAFANIPTLYAETELQANGGALSVKRNSLFGRPLTTCVREYLLMRHQANQSPSPASLDEIFDALKAGGYDLAGTTSNVDDQKRGVAISLGKNSTTFVRLPTGDWALLEWYPNYKEKKKKAAENGEKSSREEEATDEKQTESTGAATEATTTVALDSGEPKEVPKT